MRIAKTISKFESQVATMHVVKFPCTSLVLLLLLVTEVLAEDDDTDFLMNVFSDIGP